jgi:hypothetical protein
LLWFTWFPKKEKDKAACPVPHSSFFPCLPAVPAASATSRQILQGMEEEVHEGCHNAVGLVSISCGKFVNTKVAFEKTATAFAQEVAAASAMSRRFLQDEAGRYCVRAMRQGASRAPLNRNPDPPPPKNHVSACSAHAADGPRLTPLSPLISPPENATHLVLEQAGRHGGEDRGLVPPRH